MPSDPQNSDYVYHFDAANSSSWPSFSNTRQQPNTLPIASSSSARPPPPSYEEAISEPELPSRIVLSSVASENVSELIQVVVEPPSNSNDNNTRETQPLLSDTRQELKSIISATNSKLSEESRSLDNNSNNTSNGEAQQPQFPPPGYSLSDATFERTQEGVFSDDDKLNKESESLFRFFQAHNDKPQMAVSILGYHEESRSEHYFYTDDQGVRQSGTRHYTEQVTDFHLNLEVTEYISDYGKITTVPEKNKPTKEIKELLEEYIKHKNSLKEIEMRKMVKWEYEGISKAITAAIRSQGYSKYLTISYPLRNHIVTVHSNTKLSRFARHPVTKFLCILSCLWIIFLPLSWLYKKSFKNQLRSEFQVNIPAGQWFNQNVQTIVATVRWL
ncbi:10672_t:CDS:2 [Ambispora gerdemannii]|uniref:10672_t:CDS:1 n=1 Tax=Ambispora gerdemannii TaxID=144530 RepID=A0A9N9G747_9GLOM|nr:10672_t:CDS:2 [Ambispora gerdemannii]